MVEFLEKVLALTLVSSHQSLAEKWLFFCFFDKKRKVFVAESNSGLRKKELLKYHETFPILVFERSLSVEIALCD